MDRPGGFAGDFFQVRQATRIISSAPAGAKVTDCSKNLCVTTNATTDASQQGRGKWCSPQKGLRPRRAQELRPPGALSTTTDTHKSEFSYKSSDVFPTDGERPSGDAGSMGSKGHPVAHDNAPTTSSKGQQQRTPTNQNFPTIPRALFRLTASDRAAMLAPWAAKDTQ